MSVNKFLDFDNKNQVIFYNIYLKDYKFVVKIPIAEFGKKKHLENIKIKKFDLIRYKFLLNCEE